MASRKGPVALIVAGALLALGPVWGLIGTVLGMVRAFGTLAQSTPTTPERLASDISLSLWATVAGLAVTPLGLGCLIGGIVWLVRLKRTSEGNTSH